MASSPIHAHATARRTDYVGRHREAGGHRAADEGRYDGSRGDPEIGAPLPPGVEGFSVGRAR